MKPFSFLITCTKRDWDTGMNSSVIGHARARFSVILVTHKRIDEIGGIESMVKTLVHRFLDLDIPVLLVHRELFKIAGALDDERKLRSWAVVHDEKSERQDVRAIRVPEAIYFLSNIAFSFLAAFRIVGLIRRSRQGGKPQPIVHAMDTVYGGLASLLASQVTRSQFVVHTHGLRAAFMDVSTRSRLAKRVDFLMERLVAKNCAALISVNKQARDFWVAQGVPEEKIRVIPVPLELTSQRLNSQSLTEGKRRLGVDPNALVFGYVGRLSPEKNVAMLLEAFCLSSIDASLVIVGDGPLMPSLLSFVRTRGLADKVIFTGFRSDIGNIISGFDALVLPSVIEGMPTVIIEAFRLGKPVIASRIPSIAEFVSHGENGLLFNPESKEELIGALVTLSRDCELRRSMGERGIATARVSSADRVVKDLLDIYGRFSLRVDKNES